MMQVPPESQSKPGQRLDAEYVHLICIRIFICLRINYIGALRDNFRTMGNAIGHCHFENLSL